MKILAISKEIPPVDWDSLGEVLKKEAHVLHDLYLEDHVREFYFTDQGEAVLVLECQSSDESKEILGHLPLVQKGMIRFEVRELHPYSGFSRLFL
jgi:hypothetical protein